MQQRGGMFTKKTIRDIDLTGKTVLLRADYNVPLKEGVITDDYRIKQSLPTINYLLNQNVKLVICSHLGRPKSSKDISCSLFPVAKQLKHDLKQNVQFATDCVGEVAKKAVGSLNTGEVLLLENLRYHKEEEANDKEFAKNLASLADVFVQDGFGVVHRAHTSTDAVARLLPSVAGLLLEKEVSTITRAMKEPERPLMAIIGGAKIADKLEVLNQFIKIADFVAVGGAMGNTFLVAKGLDVASSLYDKTEVAVAKDVLRRAEAESKKRRFVFAIPQDGVVSKSIDKKSPTRIVDWDTQVIADIENYPKRSPRSASTIGKQEQILDIGPFSASFIAGAIQFSNTVIWNGTMGVTEVDSLQGPIGPYAHGTETVIEALLGDFGHKPFTIVGGGDTVGYVEERGLSEHFGHVSTGGGASLELMAGRKLPGVDVLQDNK